MDGTENRLAIICQFPNQRADGPGCLTVETGCGFVEEKQQVGLGGKFNTNSESFALLNIQTCNAVSYIESLNLQRRLLTFTRHPNNSLGVLFHFKQADDFVDIGIFLGFGDRGWLSQQSAESQSFSDR